MTLQRKIEIGAVVVLLALASFLFKNWLDAHDAQKQAEATVKAQETVIAQNEKRMKDLQDADDARAKQLLQQVADMQSRFGQAQTPTQIAALVAQIMGLKTPVQMVTPPATAEDPHPQPVAQVSQADAPQVKAYVEVCEECKLKLPAAQAQVESLKSQQQLAGQQLSAVENERDAWKKAARGTFWSNAKKGLRWLAIGGGIGVAACVASKHCN
jgi:hypothetical protein